LSPEGIAAEDSVAIAQQVAGKFIKGERFSQLLSGPLRCSIAGVGDVRW
jgi:hypothetical protein